MRTFDVFYNHSKVGVAELIPEGLYCRIFCKCRLQSPAVYRIKMKSELTEVMLGVCIPKGQEYVLERKYPIKHIVGEDWRFCIISEKNANKMCLDMDKDHAVVPIPMLRKMRYCIVNGQRSLVVDDIANSQ